MTVLWHSKENDVCLHLSGLLTTDKPFPLASRNSVQVVGVEPKVPLGGKQDDNKADDAYRTSSRHHRPNILCRFSQIGRQNLLVNSGLGSGMR